MNQQIEQQGTFTPWRECDRFYKRLCELLADKRKEPNFNS